MITLCGVAFMGSRRNDQLAKAWAAQFAVKGGVLDRAFVVSGVEEGEMLVKDSQALYKLIAKGKRYCEVVRVNLNLKPRHDLFATLLNAVFSPMEDTVDIEVLMSEAHMPSIVLAIATPRAARALQADKDDVRKHTRRINISGDVARGWPNAKLHVLAEHSSIFHDLFCKDDARVMQVFTLQQHAYALKYFRSMHVTAENPDPTLKRMLRLSFALPPPAQMAALSVLMGMVPAAIDALAVYRVPPEIKKKISEARAKADADAAAKEDERRLRVERLQERKLQKQQEEMERIKRLPPAARQKLEEKQARQAAKRQFRGKVVRV